MKIIKILPYVLVITLAFYLLPSFVLDDGMSIMILISITPPICFVTGAIYGARNKSIDSIFLSATAVIFLSSIFVPSFQVSFLALFLFWVVTIIGGVVGVLYTGYACE